MSKKLDYNPDKDGGGGGMKRGIQNFLHQRGAIMESDDEEMGIEDSDGNEYSDPDMV